MQAGVAVLWGLLLSQAAPTAQAPTTGRIAGRVMLEGANTPVAGARVMLLPAARPTGPMGMPPQTLTDQDGRFVFAKVAPGGYRMQVEKTGFAPLLELGRVPNAQVSAGQTIEIVVHLQKGAVIAGKILDSSGEPATDARVMAMRRFSGGPPGAAAARLLSAPGAGMNPQTNDLGEFRIAGLAPGEYIVAVMPGGRSPFGGPGVTPAANGMAATTTYYPGTTDQAAAQAIKVAAGETADNVVFSLQSVPSFRISGRVVDENGAAVAGAMVMLTADPRTGAFMGPTGHTRTGDDGRFTIAEVPSGTYRVSASVPIMMNGSNGAVRGGVVGGVSSGGANTSWSSGVVLSGANGGVGQPTEVVINGANVTGVRVVVRRPTPQ
jgi:protocatechuate 3,4-dioxygenase beta subunit